MIDLTGLKFNNKHYLILFLIIQLSAAILLQFPVIPPYISFIFILANFIFALLVFVPSKNDILVIVALFFTILSDLFLILIPTQFEIGLVFFNVVQICYAIRVSRIYQSKIRLIFSIVARFFFSITISIIAIVLLPSELHLVVILTAVYFSSLLINCVSSFTNFPRARMFAFGFLLFICCDFFVGISFALINTDLDLNMFSFVNSTRINYAWIFYPFSQILLAATVIYKPSIKSGPGKLC